MKKKAHEDRLMRDEGGPRLRAWTAESDRLRLQPGLVCTRLAKTLEFSEFCRVFAMLKIKSTSKRLRRVPSTH